MQERTGFHKNFEADSFDAKKNKYFGKIGLTLLDALKLHKQAGLWERKDGIRDFGNVSAHCLVEAERASVLAEKLKIPEEMKKNLVLAAATHDFFKKKEKAIMIEQGLSWESYEEAEKQSYEIVEKNFGETIAKIASSISHSSLMDMENILKKDSLNNEDVACLAMHYIDDYTINDNWVEAEQVVSDKMINDLDRRMDKNESNKRFEGINQSGIGKFQEGETTYQAQRRIGKLVEKRIAELLLERGGVKLEYSEKLPIIIDEEIKTRINKE